MFWKEYYQSQFPLGLDLIQYQMCRWTGDWLLYRQYQMISFVYQPLLLGVMEIMAILLCDKFPSLHVLFSDWYLLRLLGVDLLMCADLLSHHIQPNIYHHQNSIPDLLYLFLFHHSHFHNSIIPNSHYHSMYSQPKGDRCLGH